MTLTLAGPQPGSTQTDPSGYYSFADLPATGNYSVTPSAGGYNFFPQARAFNNLSANQTADFAATFVLASVSAASYGGPGAARDAIVSSFAVGLANQIGTAATTPLPTVLAGTRVSVKDRNGIAREAPLFFVSPGQVNFLVPPGLAAGDAIVTIMGGDGTTSAGPLTISDVAPGLFSADASGLGVAAAVVLRLKADSSQVYEPVAQFDPARGQFVALPIDLGPESDQVFLLLFGTGFRHRSSLTTVSTTVGGTGAEVLFAGPQSSFVGLDQVNVRLPRSLAARGELDVLLTVDGQKANAVTVKMR